ncbi:hypothetical protein CUJ83_09430 [Methanocella sp. CWC-04]|uniref:Uncharacterized protein n=1 Tax=Methanooceanicella nereidis TaxID=2052831 RepID=A0AAP2RD33_9EURY|nr:hypothetical protein [Methanocella sp. CWC-04]MCD1295218.1 hypothetical protein [Methanocella sp. CWC-04]
MATCNVCGAAFWAEGESMLIEGNRYDVCKRCAASVRENPSIVTQKKSSLPYCDACGRQHSNKCTTVKFAGQDFTVCGECIPPVKENPADFLAGKKGTEPES